MTMLHRTSLPILTLAAFVLLTGPANAIHHLDVSQPAAAACYLEDEGLRKELKLSAEQARS
jgi:hypothetical protein